MGKGTEKKIKERKELIRILPQPQWICFRRADTTRWLTLLLRGFWEAERFWPCSGADLVCCECGLECQPLIFPGVLLLSPAKHCTMRPLWHKAEPWKSGDLGEETCAHKALPILLGAAVEPCPGTWKLEGCWLLLHRESPHSLCVVHPDYPEHRTISVFLIPSSKHQAPCGSPVHPCISLYIPPQPWCYLIFALPKSPSHGPIRLPPVFPPSRGTCPLGEHFLEVFPTGMGEEQHFAQAVLRLQRCPDKALLYSCA